MRLASLRPRLVARAASRLRDTPWVLCSLAVALAAAALPASARADVNVAVLGIQSVEGDDQPAALVTQALRVGVGTIDGYNLLATDATLAQMVLAHDCDDPPTDRCLGDISTTLGAERLVFGQLRRVSTAGTDYAFRLTLSVFNRETGRSELSFHEQLDRTEITAEALREPARGFARRLLGVSASGGGTITIRSSVLAATVQLDGETVGQTGEGPLVLRGVPHGRHQISVTAPGRRAFTRSLVVEREPMEIEADLPVMTGPTPYDGGTGRGRGTGGDEGGGRSDMRWLGWVGVGVGVVAGAVAVYSYLQWSDTGRGGHEADFDAYTAAVCPGPGCTTAADGTDRIADVCTHFDEQHPASSPAVDSVESTCSDGDTFQTLQYVATGVAVVAVAAGVVGIATLGPGEREPSDDEHGARRAHRRRARTEAPRITPVVSPETVGLSARLRF